MRFICTQENLNQGLAVVSHIAAKNVNLPILNNILVKTDGGVLKFISTNLEIGINCLVRGRVEEGGEFTVPARVLADYVGLLPKERVEGNWKDDRLEIRCQGNNTKIKGESASDFPVLPAIKKENPFVVDTVDFIAAIQQVIFAVSLSESRPEIGGVLLNFESEDGLIVAATDSYRLAEKKITIKQSGVNKKRVIVPAKALQEIQRILSGIGRGRAEETEDASWENLEIYLSENQILFAFDNIELISRVIEGQYPDYTQIIPGAAKTTAVVPTEELIKNVKTASLFVKSGINDISLKFQPKDLVVVSAANTQVGENISEVIASVDGDKNEVVLNYRYFLDGLQAIKTPEVLIEVIDNNAPVMIKPALSEPEAVEKRDYLYLIMPIKQ